MTNLWVVPCLDVEGPVQGRLESWDGVEAAMRRLLDDEFRRRYADEAGGSVRLSWFLLDWTGYRVNPQHRVAGYGAVRRHYEQALLHDPRYGGDGDGFFWHYHHAPADGSLADGGWSADWNSHREYEQQLNRWVLDWSAFPSAYRAGGTIESNEASNWLERWIPFDYSSRAPAPHPGMDRRRDVQDLAREIAKTLLGRGNIRGALRQRAQRSHPPLWDWSRAPSDWSAYHPDFQDYQRPGSMRRTIFRCLDVSSRAYRLSPSDVRAAFARAEAGEPTILSIWLHDYDPQLSEKMGRALAWIQAEASRCSQVSWRYATADEAAREALAAPALTPLGLRLEAQDGAVTVSATRELFGPQPYLAVRFTDGRAQRLDMEVAGPNLWRATLPGERVQQVGAGACDVWGYTAACVLDLPEGFGAGTAAALQEHERP